jgi:hypothetical protein
MEASAMGQFDDPNVIHLEGVITKSKLPYTRTAKTKLPWTAVAQLFFRRADSQVCMQSATLNKL